MNEHRTVDNVHDIISDNHVTLRGWLHAAAKSWPGQVLSHAAFLHVRSRVGSMTQAEEVALGYVIGVIVDFLQHMDSYDSPRAAAHQLAANAKDALRGHHVARLTKLHPLAAAQVATAMGYLEDATRHR